MSSKNYYEILGVEHNAELHDIKRAFRKAIRQHHPDVDPSESAKHNFQEAVEAFDVLANDKRRQVYDDFLAENNTELGPADPIAEMEIEDWKRDSQRRSEKYRSIEMEELLMLGILAETGVVDGLLSGAGDIIDSVSDALDGISELF